MAASQTESKSFELHIGRSVSLDHAAELLGVSRRTIYNRIREGRLQTVPTLGSSKRVLLQSVIDVGRRGVRRNTWRETSRGRAHDISAAAVTVTMTQSGAKGEEDMEVKTQIRAGDGDGIWWGS